MNLLFSEAFSQYKNEVLSIIENFRNSGTLIGSDARNIVKFVEIDGRKFNFKSFKQHNFINRHVYKFYRKSKARRSFEYANILLENRFHTPNPVAYVEFHDFWGLTSSFYISEQLENCFTLKEVFSDSHFPDREHIIRNYTSLIYDLHENGIEFIDNAPGNFLIKNEKGIYNFYLVDLNRMNFHDEIEISKRLSNFSRLTDDLDIIKIISQEYAVLSDNTFDFCYKSIFSAVDKRQLKLRLKKNLKFYKYFLK